MKFSDFQKIATYLNEINRGKFTKDYWEEYKTSRKLGKPTNAMVSLCDELYTDMDFMDYTDLPPFMNEICSVGELDYILGEAIKMIG